MSMETLIREKLTKNFSPLQLEIVNESQLHHGHAGSPNSGESHFRVKITSAQFIGKSRIERHRMINKVLEDELSGPIHALAISAETP